MADLDYCSLYYEPPDVDAAHEAWGANCGPCAFAALLSKPVNDVRQHFADIERRRYVNPTQMQAALRSAGRRYQLNQQWPWAPARMLLMQITGPWMLPGVPPQVAYRYTHWIAARSAYHGAQTWTYDVNIGFWVAAKDWRDHMATQLVSLTKRATGWEPKLSIA